MTTVAKHEVLVISSSTVHRYSNQSEDEMAHYVNDVTRIAIPSWVDTSKLKLGIDYTVLQNRRPDACFLHNHDDAAAWDMKKW